MTEQEKAFDKAFIDAGARGFSDICLHSFEEGWGAALEWVNQKMSWQPIEIAPKDGKEIIAFGVMLGSYGYADDEKTWTGVRWSSVDNRWFETKPTPRYSNGFQPTHWMPIPQAPNTLGRKRGGV